MGPSDLTSAEYAYGFNEVKVLGSSTDNDPERAAIAQHWLAENLTVRETGLWLKAALNIAAAQGTLASLSDTVRLFALLGLGVADAVVVRLGSYGGFTEAARESGQSRIYGGIHFQFSNED